ncbi:hypothetical protein PN498_15055 [Oscillatoria sp. CS-180]|uniref:hypothetical protein n=1 Tax=Oscillatoria sp. CS-180 TaxID=3021720 RepID=UPI00232A8129|nr:hypothetical protein [Oscillatoria sp. CS-180]MDB9527317.1 hypothetical protein [Oscillatoria sp. CS-180]
MSLTYLPLLSQQRNLYRLPPSPERFQAYLRLLIDTYSQDISLPLGAMNPMAKEHVPAFLDKLIELDADAIAATATTTVQGLAQIGDYQVTLVVSDDLKGGWTNRYTSDFNYRFRQQAYYQRGWIPVILWVSEEYSSDRIGAEVQMAIFRTAYVHQHGSGKSLRDLLAQEAHGMAQARITQPQLDKDDLDYTRMVLADRQDSTDMPTLIAALYGDRAAHQLGYPCLGLSPNAGLALAVAQAQTIAAST